MLLFGSLARRLHLNPQEMEKKGLQLLRLMLRSDSLKTQLFFMVEGLVAELLQL